MKRFYPILTVLAGAGYITSLALYGLTFNDVNSKALPIYWPLTFVLLGIWLIAILKLRTDPEARELQRKKQLNPIPMLKLWFKGTPAWILVIAVTSFVFAIASFVILMNAQPGVVSIIDGKHVLHNHGNIIRELTDEEYKHALAIEARQFIGHYLAFFAVGTAILYPKKTKQTISNISYE